MLISSILLTFILIVFISLNNTNNENKNVLSNTNKDKQVINSNMITMMYETEAEQVSMKKLKIPHGQNQDIYLMKI